MDSFAPVTGSSFHVHDRNNLKVPGLFQKNNGVGKIATEMSSGGRIKPPESFRGGTDFEQQPFHLTIKTHAELGGNFGVITALPQILCTQAGIDNKTSRLRRGAFTKISTTNWGNRCRANGPGRCPLRGLIFCGRRRAKITL
jgi:hypothetical protein